MTPAAPALPTERPALSRYEAILRKHRDRAFAEAEARVVPGPVHDMLRSLVMCTAEGVWVHAHAAAEEIHRLTRDEPGWLMGVPEPEE